MIDDTLGGYDLRCLRTADSLLLFDVIYMIQESKDEKDLQSKTCCFVHRADLEILQWKCP